MRCVGQSTTADQHSTIQDSAITQPRVIADSQTRSTVRPASEPAYQYRRVRRAEPAAPRRRLARPRRRTGASVACQRRRSSLRAVLVAAATTTASPIAMPKKTATAATLIKPFIAHDPPGHHRARPEPLTLPGKPSPES